VENIFVLFAKSGMGKTSLLNAGLIEPLRQKGFLPMVIRFNDPEIPPLNSVYTGIEEAIKQGNENVTEEYKVDYEAGETETFWQFFKTAAFWSADDKPLTPVLIFDQFEEFFTLHAQDRRDVFITQLADLVRGRIPKTLREAYKSAKHPDSRFPYSETAPQVRVVISIREDYLAYLEEMSQEIPNILRDRFRLLPLKCQQAKDAITKPAALAKDDCVRAKGFSYAPETVAEMLDFLCERIERGKIAKTNEVEPFQLQLLCQHIEEVVNTRTDKKEEKDGYVVQKSDLGGKPGMKKVLQGFYENRVKELGTMWGRRKVYKLCEKGLIESQRRLSLEEGYIARRYNVSRKLLSHLVDGRLLRSESRVGSFYYELSHDTLVQPILESRRGRKTKRHRIFVLIIGSIVITTAIFYARQKNINQEINALYSEAEDLIGMGHAEAGLKNFYRILEIDESRASIYRKIFGENRAPIYKKIFREHLAAKEYREAIKIYERANENNIKNEMLHYWAGRLYAGAHDYKQDPDKAIVCYKEAIEIAEKIDSRRLETFYTALGDIYGKVGKFGKAEEAYRKVLELKEGNTDAYKGLIKIHLKSDKLEDASKVSRNALNVGITLDKLIDPEIRRLIKRKGIGDKFEQLVSKGDTQKASDNVKSGDEYAFLGKPKKAIQFYQEALKLDNRDRFTYIKLAVEYIKLRKPLKAIAVYLKAVKVSADLADIYEDISREMKKESRPEILERLYHIASAVDRDDALYYEELGNHFNELEVYDGAAANYKKASDLNDKNENIYKKLITAYVKHGNQEEAISIYQKAVEANPYFADIYRDISWEMEKKKMDKAREKLYRIASNVDIKEASYFKELGDAYSNKLGNYKEAVKNYEKALGLNPRDGETHKKLAIATINQGKQGKVIDIYRNALQVSINYAGIYKDIAEILKKRDMVKDFEKLNQIASVVDLRDVAYYAPVARDAESLKKYDRAYENYRQVIRLDPGNTEAKSRLAQLELIRENFKGALEQANQVLEKDNIAAGCSLAMRFIKISSLLFQKEKTRASQEYLQLLHFLPSASQPAAPGDWNSDMLDTFIKDSKRKKSEKKFLRQLIDVLKSPINQRDKKLKDLKKASEKVF
jgi:tetratricopeptide (TPR) repeat protein